MEKKETKRRLQLSGANKVVLIVLVLLTVVTVLINILKTRGLSLIHGELYLLLPLSILVVAVGWGAFALFRRIGNRTVRVVAGILAAILLLVVLTIGMSYLSVVISLAIPQRYATVSTEDGAHRLVVMRVLDTDEDRVEQRHAARLESDPDGTEEITVEDWGYIYTAYAPVGKLFYRPESLLEGEVHIGYASRATLMVDWQEDATIGHFFVRDPEVCDGGEMLAETA